MGQHGGWRGATVFAIVAVGATIAVVWLADETTRYRGDARYYHLMAEGEAAPAPFGYRILMPAVARALPWHAPTEFAVVTVLALAGAAVLLFAWLRGHTSDRRAAIGVGLFAASGPVAEVLRRPYLTDPVGWLGIAAVVWATSRRRWVVVAAVAAVSALNRESTLLVLIFPLVVLAQRRAWQLAVLVVAPAAVVLGCLRLTSLFTGSPVEGRALVTPTVVVEKNAEWYGSAGAAALYALVYAWGITPLLLRSLRPHAERAALLAFAAVGVASLCFATDWQRLLGFCFPVMAAALARSRLTDEHAWTIVGIQAASSLVLVVASYRPSVPVAVGILLAQGLVLALGMRDRDGRGPRTAPCPAQRVLEPSSPR